MLHSLGYQLHIVIPKNEGTQALLPLFPLEELNLRTFYNINSHQFGKILVCTQNGHSCDKYTSKFHKGPRGLRSLRDREGARLEFPHFLV